MPKEKETRRGRVVKLDLSNCKYLGKDGFTCHNPYYVTGLTEHGACRPNRQGSIRVIEVSYGVKGETPSMVGLVPPGENPNTIPMLRVLWPNDFVATYVCNGYEKK